MTNKVLHKEIWIKAPVEKVFACFTEEEAMLSWHGKEVEVEPVPGGIYKVVFENGTTILGEYREVVPNEKVVYTASYEGVSSVVTIHFSPQDGGTLVRLQQEFAEGQDTSSFDHGWDYFLDLLRFSFRDPDKVH